MVYATLLSAFYLPLIVMLLGLILRGVAFEFRYKTQTAAVDLGFELCRRILDLDLYPRDDRRCPGGRVAVHERSIFRW